MKIGIYTYIYIYMTCNFGKYFLEWIDRLGMLSALFEAEGREGIIFTGEKEDFHECPVNVPEKQLEIQWSKIGDPKSTNVHRHASFSGHKLRAFFGLKPQETRLWRHRLGDWAAATSGGGTMMKDRWGEARSNCN